MVTCARVLAVPTAGSGLPGGRPEDSSAATVAASGPQPSPFHTVTWPSTQ